MNKIILLVVLLVSFNAASECRNPAVKRAFDKLHGYPHGRKGYVADHLCPLSCGGFDNIGNLQYQTLADGKAKDRWETTNAGCKLLCDKSNSTYPVRRIFNCKS